MITAVGPAHSHTASHAAALVLDDFRRVETPPAARNHHVDTLIGHFHGAEAPERHYHPRTDSGVVYLDAEGHRQAAADTDDLSLSPTLAAFVALLPTAMVGITTSPSDVFRAGDPWPVVTHATEPLERPPRTT